MTFGNDFRLPAGVPVVDSHLHMEHWADGAEFGYPDFRAVLGAYREKSGLTYGNLACIPVQFGLDASQNMFAALLKLSDPSYFAHGGLIYPKFPVSGETTEAYQFAAQAQELLDIGFDGIKMLESKPNVRKRTGVSLADPVYEPFFSLLEEWQIHLLWHVNDPEPFWNRAKMSQRDIDNGWCYAGEGFLSYEQGYAEVYEVLKRHPKLKATFAHLFFLSEQPERLTELFERYPNVCVDITPGSEMFIPMTREPEKWKAIFSRYADRILLGTDMDSLTPPEQSARYLQTLCRFLLTEDDDLVIYNVRARGLGLDAAAAEKILGGNFLRRVGEKPRRISEARLKAYIERELWQVQDAADRMILLEYCRNGQIEMKRKYERF